MIGIVEFRRLALSGIAALGLSIAPLPAIAAPPWSNPPAGTTVVDAKGNVVGQLVGVSTVEREINERWVVFSIGTQGLQTTVLPLTNILNFNIYYTVPGCPSNSTTNPPYMVATNVPANGYVVSAPPFTTGYVTSGSLYYPGPAKPITVYSILGNITSLSPLVGICQDAPSFGPPFSAVAGVLKKVNLGPFTPPFTVK
jgi:hypothetical protein